MDWRTAFVEELHRRDVVQCAAFKTLFQSYNGLQRQGKLDTTHTRELEAEVADLKAKTRELTVEVQTRRSEKIESGESSIAIKELEEKVRGLQEELTSEFRTKAESAETSLKMTQSVQLLKKELQETQEKLEAQIVATGASAETNAKHMERIESLDKTLCVVTEELQGARADRTAALAQTERLKQENDTLVERLVKQANEAVDKMNVANEFYAEMIQTQQSAKFLEDSDKAFSGIVLDTGGRRSDGTVIGAVTVPQLAKHTVVAHAAEVSHVSYNVQGSSFVTCSSDDMINMWDSRTGLALNTLRPAPQNVNFAEFSPSESFMLTGGTDRAARVYNIAQGRVKHTLTGHSEKILAGCWIRDDKRACTGSYDRTIKIWDTTRGYITRTIMCYSSCNDLAVSPDGASLASGHVDGKIRLWNANNGEMIYETDGQDANQAMTSVGFSPDGTMILTNSRDSILRLVDIRTHTTIRQFTHPAYRCTTSRSGASMSPDGQYIVAGSSSGEVIVWNALTGRAERVLATKAGSTSGVTCCEWSPAGNQIVSAHRDKTVVLWE